MARASLDLIRLLSPLVAIRVAHLDRLDNVRLLHEVEKLRQLPVEVR
jgi:hypothetical protein